MSGTCKRASTCERLKRWVVGLIIPKHVITLPKALSFEGQDAETVNAINAITQAVFKQKKYVRLDLSHCEAMSFEAGVVFCATIDRCLKLRPGCIEANYPAGARVHFVLNELGFYRLINGKEPAPACEAAPELCVSPLESHTVTMPKTKRALVKSILPLFEGVKAPLTLYRLKQLWRGFSVVIDNVAAHAYPPALLNIPDIVPAWWSAGCCDKNTGRITIVIYDQGAGIPATLATSAPLGTTLIDRKAAMQNITSLLGRAPKDNEKILMAMELASESQIKPAAVNKGLAEAKRLFHHADGTLGVISGYGRYEAGFSHDRENIVKSTESLSPLKGTLIVWNLENIR